MSKGHLPGAAPAHPGDGQGAPLTQHHATTAGQSRPAMTSWQIAQPQRGR
jgi:hypothetical protein